MMHGKKTQTRVDVHKKNNTFHMLMDSDTDSETSYEKPISVPINTQPITYNCSNGRMYKLEYKKEPTQFQYSNNSSNKYRNTSDRSSDRSSDRTTDRMSNQHYDNNSIKADAGIELEHYNPMSVLRGDDMKLNSSWKVWIHENTNQNWDLDSYTSIYNIDSVGSMLRFLSMFDNLDKRVRQYYLMRDGITPIWEDNNNKTGAICSILIDNVFRHGKHIKGEFGVDSFIAICIMVMNESLVKNNQDINGLCYSIKNKSVLIKLWIKNHEINKNFIETLPMPIFKKLDSIISSLEYRNISSKTNKSRISVQLKQIKPTTYLGIQLVN